MKKLFTILSLFVIGCAYSQNEGTLKTIKVGGAVSSSAVALVTANTTSLQSASRAGKVVAVVTDTLTGGTFNYSSATLTDDNGIIFPASGGGHWIRDVGPSQSVNSKWYATGDGVTNETVKFQRFLNAPTKSLYVNDGTYMIDSTGVDLLSNTTLTLSPNATIKMIGTSQVFYQILRLSNVSNVTISGGNIVGDRTTHIGTGGEYGMGINISGCTNININNVNISNGWGDGIYIGGTSSSNVYIDHVTVFNNRRNNMSITNASHIIVSNSSFNDANGTAPQSGIDVEPNSGNTTSYITFDNVTTSGNTKQGLIITGIATTFINNIAINNLSSYSNGEHGLVVQTSSTTPVNTATINGASLSNNTLRSAVFHDVTNLKISNLTTTGTNNSGIDVYFAGNITKATLDNFKIYNTGTACTGIRLDGTCTDLTISNGVIDVLGSSIFTPTSGIRTNLTVNNVTSKNSLIEAFNIWKAYDSHLTNNTIWYPGKYGINLVNGANNTVTGNHVIGAGQIATNTYYGIFLNGTDSSNNVQNNKLRFGDSTNGPAYGIVAGGATVNNLVINNDLLSSGATNTTLNVGINNIFDTARSPVIGSQYLPLTAGMSKVLTDTLYVSKGIFAPTGAHGTTATPVWTDIVTYGQLPITRWGQIQGGNSFTSNNGTYFRFLTADATTGLPRTTMRWLPTGNVDSVGDIKAVSFTKYGGTSSEFLKADGSSDANTYVISGGSLGAATVTSINKVAITAPATSATLTILNGKTLTANNSLTLAGTDATTMTFPTTSATIARTDAANTFTGIHTFGNIQIASGGSLQSSGNSVLTLGHRADIGAGITFSPISTTTITTGTKLSLNVLETFSPTSGTGVLSTVYVSPTINQTGGANGITTGVKVAPILTAAADFRAVWATNATGYAFYQDAAAANYFAGKLGLGQTTATALLHFKAGTATVSTAPIKLTAGVVLTTPESGVLETNAGNELYYSTSTTAASRGFIQINRYAATATSLTADANQNTIDVTATGQTITLPTAVGILGRTYTIKLTASGSCTVGTTSSQTIDGSTTYSLSAQYKYVKVQSTNANWIIIGNN